MENWETNQMWKWEGKGDGSLELEEMQSGVSEQQVEL